MLDCTYRVQIPHRSGQLSLVAGAIAKADGLIGDVVTISIGREHSIREITVEVRDTAQAERVAELVDEVPGVRVLWHQDRALIAHEGGKLRMDAIHPGARASRRCATCTRPVSHASARRSRPTRRSRAATR